jgi:hypothetical protein
MTEALAVVGLASNVLQFIEFGTRLYGRIKEITSSASGVPTKLQTLGDHLGQVLKTLEELNEAGHASLEHELKTIESGLRQANKLDTLLDSYRSKAKQGCIRKRLRVDKVWTAFKSIQEERKIEEFYQALDRLLALASLQIQMRTAAAVEEVNIKVGSAVPNEELCKCAKATDTETILTKPIAVRIFHDTLLLAAIVSRGCSALRLV